MAPLTAAIIAMLIQQSLMTMSTSAIPNLWKYIGEDFGLGDGMIAVYSLMVYGIGFFASSAAGSTIIKVGPLRASQVCLIGAAWGTLIFSFGVIWLIVPVSLMLGVGMGPSTPASSQILARFSTPRRAPLVFSIKQTGVPIGGALAGFVLVPIAEYVSWQAALLLCGVAAWTAAIWMQRFRDRFDDERDHNRRISVSDVGTSFRAATATPALRKLAFAGMAYSGLQVGFMYYFITYSVSEMGLTEIAAGQIYGISMGLAIVGRIFWGWLAGGVFSSRALLVFLSFSMFAATAALGLATPEWGIMGLGAAALAFGATGVSWNGVHLAEVARHAPAGQVAVVMGGVISCCFLGLIALPALLGFVFVTLDLFGIGFIVISLPSLLCGFLFMWPDRQARP
jgi:fucose permease